MACSPPRLPHPPHLPRLASLASPRLILSPPALPSSPMLAFYRDVTQDPLKAKEPEKEKILPRTVEPWPWHPLSEGDAAPPFTLSDASTGQVYDLDSLKGRKIHLAFLRYSACMMSLNRVQALRRRHKAYADAGLVVLCIFESPPSDMQAHAVPVAAGTVPLLCDAKGTVFAAYRTEHGCFGSPYGCGPCWHCCYPRQDCCWVACCFASPTLQHFTSKAWNRLPADLLIDEDGTIRAMHKGKDFGDHMPWARIDAFAGVGGAQDNAKMKR